MFVCSILNKIKSRIVAFGNYRKGRKSGRSSLPPARYLSAVGLKELVLIDADETLFWAADC